MSSRSPRGSLSGASSAEVADDFGESLKDLLINNRYEISNLTIIAKENTEHAQAISKTLENHIKTTTPSKKLPALYVLDSVVKNVGTPYTVYLGRNLYSTFMEAYTLVDANTRRQMEGMLKTWKEPVPGSMDPRPVFPPETVRPIESALIKAKTAALQRKPGSVMQRAEMRNTPTPPQFNGAYGPPQGQPSQYVHQPYGAQQAPANQQGPYVYASTSTLQHQLPYGSAIPLSGQDQESIKRDVAAVISQFQAKFGANPFDQAIRTQLNALLQLQQIITSQVLDLASLDQVRRQITNLAATAAAPPPVVPVQQPWQAPAQVSQPAHFIPHATGYAQPQPNPQPPVIDAAALNGLQALLANERKPGTPQMRNVAPALQSATHSQLSNLQTQAAAAPAMSGVDLLASLSKSGLLPGLADMKPTPQLPPPSAAPPPPSKQSTVDILESLRSILPQSSQTATPTLPPAPLSNPSKPRIPMTSASLKTFRPELVYVLYEAEPNQCSTCGRRFAASDDGRAKKARHLDWHFRTNQRMADPNTNRGQHRNWYPTELDWINLREFDPSTTTAAERTSHDAMAAKKASVRPEAQILRAPPGVTKTSCNICFEEMKSTYSEELQDWVFRNATMHGGKIVHATCLADVMKARGPTGGGSGGGGSLAAALAGLSAPPTRQRSATPDSMLGKRKAEMVLSGGGVRMRTD